MDIFANSFDKHMIESEPLDGQRLVQVKIGVFANNFGKHLPYGLVNFEVDVALGRHMGRY